jgi:hypothetical protein
MPRYIARNTILDRCEGFSPTHDASRPYCVHDTQGRRIVSRHKTQRLAERAARRWNHRHECDATRMTRRTV